MRGSAVPVLKAIEVDESDILHWIGKIYPVSYS